ncbi:hypothetical protein ACFSUS_05235 [Spirosoma soli]|uniref:Lipoprotein n=1 Tax=Spirosoma soli TaxID=1770529 RepID=A0ABW5LZ56_9BACT
MKVLNHTYILLLGIMLGCDTPFINGGYVNIGDFKTRLDAQNKAVLHILANYASIPKDKYYKVKYAVPDAPLNEQRENAIWYHKGDAELVFEADVSSGPVCKWKEVSRTVLVKASKSAESLFTVDTLAKPNQPFRQCLFH